MEFLKILGTNIFTLSTTFSEFRMSSLRLFQQAIKKATGEDVLNATLAPMAG
jgi:hypothetical protein